MEELESAIVQRAAKGDEKAFRCLYDHYAPFIWKFVFRTAGGDQDAAREIVQDTFVRVHRSLKKFAFGSALSTWLFRIAYNSAMAHLGRKARQSSGEVTFEDQTAGEYRSDGYDNREMAHLIMKDLDSHDRFLLTAREIDNFSFDEIAVITGKNPGALRTRLHRMKEEIRNRFLPTRTGDRSSVYGI